MPGCCSHFSDTVERAARNRPLNFILDNAEARVLRALVEKDVTTLDYYGLSRAGECTSLPDGHGDHDEWVQCASGPTA
jgi:hypothetical protein